MKVSVILTSYNHANYLKESIDSVLNQTFRDFELIIVDDFSTDNSREIIESYHDERIRFIKHEYNYGYSIVKEEVENYIKGEYIAIQHSDDCWAADKLEKQVRYLDTHENCGAVFTDAQVINDDGSFYDDKDGFYYNIFAQQNRSRFEWLRFFFQHGNCLCHPSLLIRSKIYIEDNLLNDVCAYRQIPDLVIWTCLCLKYDIYIIREKLTYFRIHDKGRRRINSSAFSFHNASRNSVELFTYTRYFLEIDNEDDFGKIFPEWENYSCKEYFNHKYALARMSLFLETSNYTKLYGLNLLNELMSDRDERANLIKYYGYTDLEHYKLTGQYDVFNIFPKYTKQICTLYYDEHGEWTTKNSVRLEYDLIGEYRFCHQFDIEVNHIENPILYFRFDPSEEIIIKCKIYQFSVNGQDLPYRPIDSLDASDEGDVFATLDPMYIAGIDVQSLEEPVRLCVAISGEVKALSNEEIVSYMAVNMKKKEKKEKKRKGHFF